MNVLLKQLTKLQNLYLSFCVDLPGTSFNLISSLTLVFLLLLGHRYVLIHNIHRYAFVVFSSVSNSFNVLPALFFHSVSPFAFRPITMTAAVEGLLKM